MSLKEKSDGAYITAISEVRKKGRRVENVHLEQQLVPSTAWQSNRPPVSAPVISKLCAAVSVTDHGYSLPFPANLCKAQVISWAPEKMPDCLL